MYRVADTQTVGAIHCELLLLSAVETAAGRFMISGQSCDAVKEDGLLPPIIPPIYFVFEADDYSVWPWPAEAWGEDYDELLDTIILIGAMLAAFY